MKSFESKLEAAQALNDEGKRPRDAMKAMIALRGTLPPTPKNRPYINGLEISILWMAKAAEDKEALRAQIENIMSRPNAPFAAIERFERSGHITFHFLYLGYTHPEIVTDFTLPGQVENAAPAERLALRKAAALKWGNFDFSRSESDWGMSYGDGIVEAIWGDDDLDVPVRLDALKELAHKLRGSARGNAEYCLTDLYRKRGDQTEGRKWGAACAKTYGALSQGKMHHREMLQLCQEAAQ